MGSLKDALLKAGLKATTPPKAPTPVNAPNERAVIHKKKITETIVHQEQRNFCEECQQVYPDVEFYVHRNPTTEAQWICVRCADRLKILDTCRMTAQSDTSLKRLFRREHGATRSLSEFPVSKSKKPTGPNKGNS